MYIVVLTSILICDDNSFSYTIVLTTPDDDLVAPDRIDALCTRFTSRVSIAGEVGRPLEPERFQAMDTTCTLSCLITKFTTWWNWYSSLWVKRLLCFIFSCWLRNYLNGDGDMSLLFIDSNHLSRGRNRLRNFWGWLLKRKPTSQ